jgi:hypothetical protein
MPKVNRKGKGKHTQSVLFYKAAGWTKASSRKWLKEHKDSDTGKPYYTDGYDESATLHRWRQVDPEDNKFRYRPTVIEKKQGKPSISLLRGFPKGSRPDGLTWSDAMEEAAREANEQSTTDGNSMQEENMSIADELKAITKQLAERDGKIVELQAEIDQGKEKLSGLQTTIDDHLASIETMKTEHATAIKAKDDEIATGKASIAELEGQVTGLENDLKKAKGALVNPAVADAGTTGEKEPAGDGGDGEGKGAGEHYAEFKRLRNAGKAEEATRYWEANREAIAADQQAILEKERQERNA